MAHITILYITKINVNIPLATLCKQRLQEASFRRYFTKTKSLHIDEKWAGCCWGIEESMLLTQHDENG